MNGSASSPTLPVSLRPREVADVTTRKPTGCQACRESQTGRGERYSDRIWRMPNSEMKGSVDNDQRAFLGVFSERSPDRLDEFRKEVLPHLADLEGLPRQYLSAQLGSCQLVAGEPRGRWVARAKLTRAVDAINAACERFGRATGLVSETCGDGGSTAEGAWVLKHLVAAVIALELRRRTLASSPAIERLLAQPLRLGGSMPIGLGSMTHNLRQSSGVVDRAVS